MNSRGARFDRGDPSHRVGILRRTGGRYSHREGKRRAFVQAHGRTALEIRSDQQRNLGVTLQVVRQHRGGVDLAALDPQRRPARLHDKAAEVVLLHLPQQILVSRALGGEKSSVVEHHHELPEFFLERHTLQCLRDPFLAVGGKFRRGKRGSRSGRFRGAAGLRHQ